MTPPATDADSSSSRWLLRGLAVIWLGLFGWWFHSFDLPRQLVWPELIDVLLENVSPIPRPDAPPSGWGYFPQRWGILGVAAAILGGGWALGNLALRALRLHARCDGPIRTVFAFGLGLSGLSLLTLGLGLAGALHRGLLLSVIVILIVWETACRLRRRRSPERPASLPWWQRRWRAVPILCIAAVTPFLLAMLLGAMLPSTDFDVKEYHLEGPKEFFLQGRVSFLPHNVYTSFPFLTEMLSLLAMVLMDDWYLGAQAGKTVLMSFAPLTALGLFAAGRRWFGTTTGWLCVLLYLTTPWVYRTAIIAYAEGGLTFYLLASLLAVMWSGQGTEYRGPPGTGCSVLSTRYSERGTQYPVLSTQTLLCGLLAGSAVACKYPGVLTVVIPLGGFLLLAAWRRSASDVPDDDPGESTTKRSRAQVMLATAGLFAFGTLITFGPWMAKNIAETGNPVYPLLYNVFGGADWSAESHAKWQAGHPPTIVALAGRPAALAKNLGTRVVDVIARSDWQSPLLFGAAPLALLWWRQRRLVTGLWTYVGWLFLVWWALTHQIDRFWVPMLPVVALLAGVGLSWMLEGGADPDKHASEPDRRIAWGIAAATTLVVAVFVVFNLACVTTVLSGYNAYLIDLEIAREDVKTPSIALVEEQLPPEGRVLFVGEAQVFDADFDYVYNTVFDESLFERWTSADLPGVPPAEQPLRPAEEIRRTLAEHGITHVLVNWSEILRYRTTYGYTEFVSPERFHELVRAEVLAPVALDPRRTLRLWEEVDPAARQIVADWGGSLHWTSGDLEALQQYELFEVVK